MIASLSFYNSPETITTNLKQTFKLFDLLSYAGGTFTGMLAVFSYLTSNYQAFNSDMKAFEDFNTTVIVTHDDPNPKSNNEENQSDNKLIKDSDKPKIYYRYLSRLRCLFKCCYKKTKDKLPKKYKEIKHIQQILKDKFDLRKIIIDVASLIYN